MLLQFPKGEAGKNEVLAERLFDVSKMNLGGGEGVSLDGTIADRIQISLAKLAKGGVFADSNSPIDRRLAIVEDEIGDGDAAGNFQSSMSDKQKQVLGVRLPAMGIPFCNFADRKSVPPASVSDLTVPSIALFLYGSHGRSFAMPPQYGSNVCRRIAENPK